MVAVSASALDRRRVGGVDPAFGLLEVTGEVPLPGPAGGSPPLSWSRAVQLGRLAVGHQLVGVAAAMLELARQHAVERIQFGRPIGSFQAVRHRLADTLVAVETARAALETAWDDSSPEGAAMAKALAGRGARTAARHCQQVLAGIGVTTEHPFHGYLRRALVLGQLLGPAHRLTDDLGRRVLAELRLPVPSAL